MLPVTLDSDLSHPENPCSAENPNAEIQVPPVENPELTNFLPLQFNSFTPICCICDCVISVLQLLLQHHTVKPFF